MSLLYPLNQPGGVSGQLIDRAQYLTTRIWWVDSATGTNALGFGGAPDQALDSWQYAITNAAALGLSANDTILLAPGHAETVVDATSLLMDVAGVRVIGLGHGALIPTITLGTDVGATIGVSAANCLIRNIKVISDLADVAAGITAANTADGLVVEDCIFTDGALTKELVIGISLAAACDGCLIQRNRFYTDVSAETGGCASAIKLVGESVRTVIAGNFAYGHYTAACLDGSTAAATGLVVDGNSFANIDTGAGLAISMHANTSGILSNNIASGTKNGTHPVVAAAMHVGATLGADAVGANAIVSPTTAAI
jgi:hypothetical protein